MLILRRIAVPALLIPLLTTGPLRADDSSGLDWDAWERMPVFFAHASRVMPLDSFARRIVRQVCGKEKPTLVLVGAVPEMDVNAVELADAHTLFPGGRKRKFTSAALLFSWLVEPEKWEYVPFLHAEHEQLRMLLGVPLRNSRGDRLKFVSPHEFQEALVHQEEFQKQLEIIARNRQVMMVRGEEYRPSGFEKTVSDLKEAYGDYRNLSRGPGRVHSTLVEAARQFEQSWQELSTPMKNVGWRDERGDFADRIEAVDASLDEVVAELRRAWFEPHRFARAAEKLEATATDLADSLQRQLDKSGDGPSGTDTEASAGGDNRLPGLIHVVRRFADLGETTSMYLRPEIYDDHPLRMVPDLDPRGLMVTSRNEKDSVQPWLSFNAMIFGSADSYCRHVPRKDNQEARDELGERLNEVQKGFAEARAAYLLADDNADRPERFAEAMDEFSAAVRSLGEAAEPFRRKLAFSPPEKDLDEKLHAKKQRQRLDETAYPPPGAMDLEIHCNRFAPFLKSWIASLASVFCFALSFGVIRRPMFWSGTTLLAVALGLMTYALFLRFVITGWVPVTTMFESVVFVAVTVSFLGLWFALVPVLWPGIQDAWRLTALPRKVRCWLFTRWYELYKTWRFGGDESTPESTPEPEAGETAAAESGGPPSETTPHWAFLVPRIALMVLTFYVLAVAGLGTGGRSIVRLWPRIDAVWQIPNGLLTWTAGLCVLVPSVWYVPRLVLVFLVSLVTVPRRWADENLGEWLQDVDRRKVYAAVGAAVSCFASIVAYYASNDASDILDPKIGRLAPLLHSNFWLTIHVLPITASYGAGALAWGLGNISLAYYLFGRYREPVASPKDHTEAPSRRRPPETCATLARYAYRAILVAVLLLIAGTILGALWADVAWGRFWGWDAKEVWSLISILAYMIILHGRYAGWAGNFGMAVGAVLGMTSILMAWYGVNFLLPGGLHSYGSGTGGQLQVVLFVAANWSFLFAAAVRYHLETAAPLPEPDKLPSAASPETEPDLG